jgi:pectate lyase
LELASERHPSVSRPRTYDLSIYNNYYDNVGDGIDTRKGAQLLVENNVFVSTKKALFSTDNGYAVARGNDFGGAINDAPAGTLTSVPYKYTLSSLDSVRSGVPSGAGANLSF